MAITWTTRHFEEWEHHLSQAIGHHSSALLTPDIPFSSRTTVMQAEGVTAVALEGESCVHLHRWQPPGKLLLWLPRHGWVHDRINGQPVLAERGTAMLCLPGDELIGETTCSVKGVSILLSMEALGPSCRWDGFSRRHLAQGSEVVAAVDTAEQLVTAMAAEAAEATWLAGVLVEQLLFWRDLSETLPSDRTHGAVERRLQIRRAMEWIDAHLHEALWVTDLAEALHLSTRSLQFCFRQELGISPLEAIRRRRFRRLRRLLANTPLEKGSIESLFQQCGLSDSAITRRQYRQWCGETPSQSQFLAAGLGMGEAGSFRSQ
ncbi:hypothetical protein LBMAG41_09140 [Cyanobium sp.]|nr:hypothetical protein LBMAG41_09140 [Cyanobium sp.]